jgi:pimeloyl-ACP methyl ester carboxylesterase
MVQFLGAVVVKRYVLDWRESIPELPFEGEAFPSPNPKYIETIVFVHHFGGNKRSLLRHIEWTNSIGFNAVAFNLTMKKPFFLRRPPISRNLSWGLKHIWADEISTILNLVPGSKILFTFSNPTASAIEAIALRSAKDIKALVCDSGPFANLPKANWNYIINVKEIKSLPLRVAGTFIFTALWGLNHTKTLKENLSALPSGFPILSIRGWADKLIPPNLIDTAFQEQDNIRLETVALPDADHLRGLKDFEHEYTQGVKVFLKKQASVLSE